MFGDQRSPFTKINQLSSNNKNRLVTLSCSLFWNLLIIKDNSSLGCEKIVLVVFAAEFWGKGTPLGGMRQIWTVLLERAYERNVSNNIYHLISSFIIFPHWSLPIFILNRIFPYCLADASRVVVGGGLDLTAHVLKVKEHFWSHSGESTIIAAGKRKLNKLYSAEKILK